MIIRLCLLSLLSAVVFIIIKQQKHEYSLLLELFVLAAVALSLMPQIKIALDFALNYFDMLGVSRDFFAIAAKTVGISLVAEFTAETCRDAGEGALASKLVFAAKLLIIINAMPVIKAVTQIAIGLINS